MGCIQYYFFNSIFIPLIHLLLNYLSVFIIYYANCNKESLNEKQLDKSTLKNHIYIFLISGLEIIIFKLIPLFCVTLKSTNILMDLLLFIPVSLIFELIFDFFHYWVHRYFHINKTLYINFHKNHHLDIYPNVWTTFNQNPIDYICNTGIPLILTTVIVNKCIGLSEFQYVLFLIYKIFIEISGHCGKKIKGCTFIQNVWLVKLLNIHLHVDDHDYHHTHNNCNYSKRFKIWDVLFKTYKKKINK
jgi:sterol desaturase/sphingolipid hydroxylase (fatty acid hydroxylase superfamily)